MIIIIWVAALLHCAFGVFATCCRFAGELPDGRWENAIGGGRCSEVIALEDQHGKRD